MTIKEIEADISRLLELCNRNQLSLILRIVQNIVRGGESMTYEEKYPNRKKAEGGAGMTSREECISAIMNLTPEERRELLELWKATHK